MEYKFKDHKKHCWYCQSTKMIEAPTKDYYRCLKCGATFRELPELNPLLEICGILVNSFWKWEYLEVQRYGKRY